VAKAFCSRTIPLMRRRSWVWLAGSAFLLVAILAPYLAAWRAQPPGFSFTGFLLNPVDGFSYLAKMRQGAGGSWLFRLPYAAEPGQGTLLFVYYVLLGHMQRLLGASPLIVLHGARLAGVVLMIVAAFVFYRATLPEAARRWALVLAVLGSGLGWLGVALGRLSIDLWVPEAFPFLSALASAHFPLALAGMLTALSAMSGVAMKPALRLGGAGLAGLVLGAVQPFGVVVVTATILLWAAWLRLRPVEVRRPMNDRQRLVAGAVFVAVATPWLVYDFWVTRQDPALAAWSAQNLTPTPPLVDVALGLGVALVLALLSIFLTDARRSEGGRLLICWLAVGVMLAFAPIGLQRRMLLGIFFPIAGLAALVLTDLASQGNARRWAAYALFVLCLPSDFVVLAATLGAALTQQPDLVMTAGERASYAWIADHLPSGSLVLAGDVTGNRLPAFADVRVRYGHPFETPHADQERAWIEAAFASRAPVSKVLADIADHGIDYVYVGPRERSLAGSATNPEWLTGLIPIYQAEGVSVYGVPHP